MGLVNCGRKDQSVCAFDQDVCSTRTADSQAHHDSPTKHRTDPTMNINDDFSARIVARSAGATWTPSPLPGVDRRMLDRVGDEVAMIQRSEALHPYADEARGTAQTGRGGQRHRRT